jgi:hypothetical protein
MTAQDNLNPQQFFHGSQWDFKPGQILDAKDAPESHYYDTPDPHVYYTTDRRAASRYADNGTFEGMRMKPRVYTVDPLSGHEPDPESNGLMGYGEPGVDFRAKRVRITGEAEFIKDPRERYA